MIESKEKGDYIVLDGNRRVSALKVLSNPDVLSGTNLDDAIKKSLTRAATGFKRENIEPIRCVLFEKRDFANDWIYRRHTGAADGEGRINWGPLEIQRFSGDHSVLDVIDFVGRNADFSSEEWASTKEMIESKKSTNLSRLIESAAGQKHLGIIIEKDNGVRVPKITSEPKWAINVLKKIIEDVRDGVVDSRALNKSSDIELYFKSLPKSLQPSRSIPRKAVAIKSISLKASVPKVAPSAQPNVKTAKTPRTRKNLAPNRHLHLAPASTKGQELLREAASLDADRFTISCAFVLRAFTELAISDYMATHGMPLKKVGKDGKIVDLSLSERADAVSKDIVSKNSGSAPDLRGFNNSVVNKSAPSSIQSLNGFVHNQFQIPTPEALRAGWESCVPVYIAAFGKA